MMAAMRFQIDSPSAIPTVARSATSPGIVASEYMSRWIAGEGVSVQHWRRSSKYLPRLTPGCVAVPKTSPPSRSAKSFVFPMSTIALDPRAMAERRRGHSERFRPQKTILLSKRKAARPRVTVVTHSQSDLAHGLAHTGLA